MATLIRGYSFTSTEQVTNTKLHTLVDGGTVSGIVQADATDSLLVTSTSAPTAATGRAWVDTNQGAGRAFLKIYDNGVWRPVAEGFIGYNNGVTVARGAPVVYDTSFSAGSTAGFVPFRKTNAPTANSVQMDRAIGVAGESIANAATGLIITRGFATAIKDAATIVAGDALCPSVSTNARATTGNVGGWGNPEGSAFGKWIDASAAGAGTEVATWIAGAGQRNSWIAFKNSGGTAAYAGVTVSTFTAWTGAGTFTAAVPGTIARICQVTLTKSATNGQMVVGLRMTGAAVDIGTGAPFLAGFMTAGATANNTIRGQLIVPETTGASSNILQYYVSGTDTTGTITLTVIETGVVIGGQIV